MNTAIQKSDAALPASVAALATIGQNAVATTGDVGTGDAFGKFTKAGEWEFGQENIIVEEDSRWVINPMSLRHGHIGWLKEEFGTGRPTEVMVSLTQPLPEQPVDEQRDWGNCMGWQARCTSGEDTGQQVLFKGGSLGFLKATTGLAQKIAARAQAGETKLVPVVTLETSFYTHKSYGKIYTPELKVVDWTDMDATEDAEEAAPETAEAAPEQAPEPALEWTLSRDKPAPRRRRRTRK